jgi:hypothetical protein
VDVWTPNICSIRPTCVSRWDSARVHVTNILAKVGVHSRLEAAARARGMDRYWSSASSASRPNGRSAFYARR